MAESDVELALCVSSRDVLAEPGRPVALEVDVPDAGLFVVEDLLPVRDAERVALLVLVGRCARPVLVRSESVELLEV